MSHAYTGLRASLVAALLALPAAATAAPPQGLWTQGEAPETAACHQGPPFCFVEDGGHIELGMRFRLAKPVDIVGIRLYRVDTGPVTVTLWKADGTPIVAGLPVSGGARGWQEVLFPTTVAADPGTTYMASYHVTNGEYAATHFGLNADKINGPLTGLMTGLYCYGPSPCFPSGSYRDSNYWVTPLWQDNTAPVVGSHPSLNVTATSAAGAVVNYTAPTATDNLDDPAPAVSCTPASGSTFAPGTTTVTCSATDASGNTGTSSFTVGVTFATSGFLAPIGTGKTTNAVKAGSAIPVKWRVGDNAGGWLSDTSIVRSIVAEPVACAAAARMAGGPGSKRARKGRGARPRMASGPKVGYDADGQHFVSVVKTPRSPGTCLRIAVTLTDDLTRSVTVTLR